MANLELFIANNIVGVFRGFSEGGREFHANLTLPYRNDFHNIPMHGQFLLVQLETQDEAVLGRITALSSSGKLASSAGEEFNLRTVYDGRTIREDLREQYLRYKVDIRVLGVLRKNTHDALTFIASHRRLPHVGSPVAFLTDEVLREIANHNVEGAEIGHLALGEYIYAERSDKIAKLDWMQIKTPEVLVKFPIENLVSRRSFIFARAGFGKSNLNKLLFSKLYEKTPKISKRNHKKVPVGTVLFDPDGEYFWPDDKGRPGLCDVPTLKDQLVVFTHRNAPSPFYQSFVAGGIKLDIRRLRPSDVITIAINPEKQDQQNIRRLYGLNQLCWEELVNLIDRNGYQTTDEDIKRLLHLEDRDEAQINAARANMTVIVKTLHDRSSQLLDLLLKALAQGKLCIIDTSQMRGKQALILSSLILSRIFDRNQQEFTAAEPKTIPTLAVVEEAQTVLNDKITGTEPYITWVKEGRKYDLGAVLITQQPGSIPTEILSQGDNWFVFHLLSATDLNNIHKANAHFSDDILSTLLNEPIEGQGVFWSSSNRKTFPIPIRVLSFEKLYSLQDPDYNQPEEDTFARRLKNEFEANLRATIEGEKSEQDRSAYAENETMLESVDILATLKINAINRLQENTVAMKKLQSEKGFHWRGLREVLKKYLPNHIDDVEEIAHTLVPEVLNHIFGPQDENWESYKSEKGTTYLREKKSNK